MGDAKVPAYHGEYIVTPDDKEQILETSGKKMLNDLVIKAVPTTSIITSLSVTANGTYTAPSGAEGYSPVTVAVPTGLIIPGRI